MATTRSKSSAECQTASAETELLAFRQQLLDTDRKQKAEANALDNLRRELEQERVALQRAAKAVPEAQHVESDLVRELTNLKREISLLKTRDGPITQSMMDNRFSRDNHEPLSYTIKEAVDSVPIYDGNNLFALAFSRSCKRALELLPATAERTLVKLIMNKLRGRAYIAVEEEDITTVSRLCNRLKDVFGPCHSVDHYRGEMANIFQGANEHILDYISRVKDLRTAIIDCGGDREISLDVNALTLNSFIDGLIPRLRSDVRVYRQEPLLVVFDEAIRLYKLFEKDRVRYDKPLREERRVQFAEARSPISDRRGGQRYEAARPPNRTWEPPSRPAAWRTNAVEPRLNTGYRETNSNRKTDIAQGRGEYKNFNSYRNEPRDSRGNKSETFCRYCKTVGHDILECNKRQFYNNLKEQGNERPLPSTSGQRREEAPLKSVKAITKEAESENTE